MSDIKELYQELILDHGRLPRNKRLMEDATVLKEGYNPICGDRIRLYLKLHQGVIVDASFDGDGCAISMASTSMMIQALQGKTVLQAEQLFDAFQTMLMTDDSPHDMGKLAALAGVKSFPMRVKCATLAWHTLRAALHNDQQQQVTTE